MLGGDLRGKKDSENLCVRDWSGWTVPFRRTQGELVAYPGDGNWLYRKRPGRTGSAEKALCLPQKTQNQRSDY